MDSGQKRGKIFIFFGIALIVIIILVTAFKNKTEKTNTDGPTLFEGIKNLTKNTSETITDYIGDTAKKIIPLELKDLNKNSDGIPNVLKLSEKQTVTVTIPEENYGAASPDLPQLLPFPRFVTMENGTLQRITLTTGKPQETLFAKGDTPELFDGTFSNNLNTIITRSRTLSTLSHYIGNLEKDTKNYCPYTLTLNKKNTYTVSELEQIYGILEVNSVITSSFPPFTDYKTNVLELIKAYQIKHNLSKKPTGILDIKTLDVLSNNCSNITKEKRRSAGEQIPEYTLTYRLQSSSVEDLLGTKTSEGGAILINTQTGISLGNLKNIAIPKTYTQLFASPFTDFNIELPNPSAVVATTRPADGYVGVSYLIDSKTGKRTTLLEDIKGLMTLVSPDLNYTLYFDAEIPNNLQLFSNKNFTVRSLPFTSLPDKCTWTTNSLYIICGVPVDGSISPEAWLKGYASNDELKAYDVAGNSVTDLPQPQEEVDVFKGTISSEGNYFGFINKITMEPWMISLVDFIK